MRPRHLLMAAVAALLCGAEPLTERALGAQGSQGAQGSKTLPMPCLQMIDDRAVTAALGDGFTLTNASSSVQDSRRVSGRCTHPAARRVGVSFTTRAASLKRATPAGAFDAASRSSPRWARASRSPPGRTGDDVHPREARIFLIRRAAAVVCHGHQPLARSGLALARRAVAAPRPLLARTPRSRSPNQLSPQHR